MDASRITTDEQSTIIGVDMLVSPLDHFESILTSRHSSGTGASAIYPLLGCATRRDWHFIATGTSILLAYRQWLNKYTQRLIRILLKMLSSMSRRMPWKDEYRSFMSLLSDLYSIQVFLSKFSLYFTPTCLQHADDRAHPQVDFTMCNPPFYSDRAEVLRSAEAKELGPNAVCTGADTEMITPGGEVAFVSKMVQESLVLKTRCRYVNP